MKTFWFQMIGLVVLILLTTFLAFNQEYLLPLTTMFSSNKPAPQTPQTDKKEILKIFGSDNSVKAQINIELADTKDKRSKGLGYRENLATDSGMLFVHDDYQKYTYWMKGMQFPIDIFWISDKKIVDIIPNIPPPVEGQTDDTLERYSSLVQVNRVLETNAGFAASHNIQKGDTIEIIMP